MPRSSDIGKNIGMVFSTLGILSSFRFHCQATQGCTVIVRSFISMFSGPSRIEELAECQVQEDTRPGWLEAGQTSGRTTCVNFVNYGNQDQNGGTRQYPFHLFCVDILVNRPLTWLIEIAGRADVNYYRKHLGMYYAVFLVTDESCQFWCRGETTEVVLLGPLHHQKCVPRNC